MKTIIASEKAPKAVGPYSQAVRVGNLIFLSRGQSADPLSGHLVEGGIQPQTERVLENIRAVLEAADSTFENVVKTTVYLKSLTEFVPMNEVYADTFRRTRRRAPR